MSKVGVLTFHRCINYGSYWQARCLVEGLKSRGSEAVLLAHRSRRVDRAEWRCALQPTLPYFTLPADHPHYVRKVRKFFDAFAGLPLSRPFSLEDPSGIEEFTTVIVGSDEVWNLTHPWYGGAPLFYGEGLRAGHVASYAASFGNFGAAPGGAEGWAEKLKRFSAISVRDYNSQHLVRQMLGLEAQIVLDPCLQFPAVVRAASREMPDLARHVVVYGHSFPDWFQQNIRRWARRSGRRLISIGYRNDWADEQRIDVGPEEFARLVAACDAVATNFFHGCVFSLLNRKPFASCLSDYRSNKILDLTRLVGAGAHVMTEDTAQPDYNRSLGEPLNPGIFDAIDRFRQSSDRYLDHVLH